MDVEASDQRVEKSSVRQPELARAMACWRKSTINRDANRGFVHTNIEGNDGIGQPPACTRAVHVNLKFRKIVLTDREFARIAVP